MAHPLPFPLPKDFLILHIFLNISREKLHIITHKDKMRGDQKKMTMYCDCCDRNVVPVSNQAERIFVIRGEEIKVFYTAKVCPNCCEELYNEEMEIKLYNQAQAMYKKKMRLLQSAEIVEYMKSRKISPEELAQRISCNVREILQATKGGIQSKETDKKLKAFFKKTA